MHYTIVLTHLFAHRFRPLVALLAAALLVVGLAVIAPTPTRTSTLQVTNCADSGTGSLRNAMANATTGDTITFVRDCTSANKIAFGSAITGTMDVTIDATVGNHAVMLDGSNGGNSKDIACLFVVPSDVTLTLRGLVLQNGNAANRGVNTSAITNSGTLIVTGSTFTDNRTDISGGAIINYGTIKVTDSTFTGNHAFSDGGAITNFGNAAIAGSTFTENSAGVGGAIYNFGGTLSVTSSIFTRNSAGQHGDGGAIQNNGGILSVTSSIFSRNIAGNGGGAIANSGGSLTLTMSVIIDNFVPINPDLSGPVTIDGGGNVVPKDDGRRLIPTLIP